MSKKDERYYVLKYIKFILKGTEEYTKIFTQREKDVLIAMLNQLHISIEKGMHMDEFEILNEEYDELQNRLLDLKPSISQIQEQKLGIQLMNLLTPSFFKAIEDHNDESLKTFREVNMILREFLSDFDN